MAIWFISKYTPRVEMMSNSTACCMPLTSGRGHSEYFLVNELRRICRLLDSESAKTLVHAFITSCVDGCNTALAGSSKATTDYLQCVLNAAAPLVSGTHKFDRGLTHLLYCELQWLDGWPSLSISSSSSVSSGKCSSVPCGLLQVYDN